MADPCWWVPFQEGVDTTSLETNPPLSQQFGLLEDVGLAQMQSHPGFEVILSLNPSSSSYFFSSSQFFCFWACSQKRSFRSPPFVETS